MLQVKVKPLGWVTLFLAFGTLTSLVSLRVFSPRTTVVLSASEKSDKSAGSLPSATNAALSQYVTISATSSLVQSAISSGDSGGIYNRMNKEGTLVGTVKEVIKRDENRSVTLLFEGGEISAVAMDDELPLFPDLVALTGRKVMVTGEFRTGDNGKPQIRLMEPSHIKVVVP